MVLRRNEMDRPKKRFFFFEKKRPSEIDHVLWSLMNSLILLLARKHHILAMAQSLCFLVLPKWLKNHAINLTESNQNVHLKELFRYADHVFFVVLFFLRFSMTKKKKKGTCWKVKFGKNSSLKIIKFISILFENLMKLHIFFVVYVSISYKYIHSRTSI